MMSSEQGTCKTLIKGVFCHGRNTERTARAGSGAARDARRGL